MARIVSPMLLMNSRFASLILAFLSLSVGACEKQESARVNKSETLPTQRPSSAVQPIAGATSSPITTEPPLHTTPAPSRSPEKATDVGSNR
jgi:hypothetical protein